MVGVPGRSRGCNTCRQRRVKCDEAKPICQRCVKGRFECLGYSRHTLWRHVSTAPFPIALENAASQQRRVFPDIQGATVPGQSDESRRRTVATKTMAKAMSPPRELSLNAFQDNFCVALMLDNFVWSSYGNPWLSMAAEGKLGGLALDATRALAETHFGKFHHTAEIELRGAVQYGKCLKKLAGQLGGGAATAAAAATTVSEGPSSVRCLLIPILILLMHAGSHTDRTGAIFHLRGIAGLLHLCGPAALQQQPLLNAFEASRATLLNASLIAKQRLFLEEECWRTVPWALDPSAKTPQSQLIDILVVVPGILHQYAALEDDTGSMPDEHVVRGRLLDRVRALLIDTFRWRWQWHHRSGHLVSVDVNRSSRSWSGTTTASTLGTIGTAKQFARLKFDDFAAATEIMLYNATVMWLLALLWKISPSGASDCVQASVEIATVIESDADEQKASFEPLRRPGDSATIRDPAVEICRVFEWVARNHHLSKDSSTFLYLFPVGMALSVLEKEPDASNWARALLDTNPTTANYARQGNLAGFGFYITVESLHPERLQAQETLFSPQEVRKFMVDPHQRDSTLIA